MMEKPARIKSKKGLSQKSAKKRKCDGPTCTMFLSELSRKLALKKKQEESPINIIHTIIESLTNALPISVSKKSPEKKESPLKMETLQIYAPELLPNDTLDIAPPLIITTNEPVEDQGETSYAGGFKIPKMPLANSDVFKPTTNKIKMPMEDVAVNTSCDRDVATELTKYVGTLRRISLIAEEFNQKTAKNLKEIVDSVQEDLLKKLEEIKAEQEQGESSTSK
ncbi:uncharacterized protein LOC126972675 isoform X7 [Leptidea sinapis]|uniref:uncharacterized protein LOC126972675 isoform X7 n=1 Tax=Leptidea sinapis TaxID=189913 RepID=UPI0021C40C25|nr:uncharacterized protein LOC126972675 isoform X7 [Leptidea sinapis]